MNTSLELLYGLRGQITKDHTAFKQFLFDEYLRKKPILSHLYNVFLKHQATWLGLLLCRVIFVYTYLSIRVPRKATVLTVLKIKTETTSFKEVIHKENYRRIDVVQQKSIFIPLNILQSLTRREAYTFFKLSRIFSILAKRYPLFVVLRAVEYLVYYLKLSSCLANGTTQSVVVFSDGNPHGIALFHLSKRYKKNVIFISHGQPNKPIYPLVCTVAFLLGQESRTRYLEANARFDRVIFRGHKEALLPMRTLPNPLEQVGIFLSKMTYAAKIIGVLHEVVSRYRAKKIVIRPHPNFTLTTTMKAELIVHPSVQISVSDNIVDDVAASDLVLAGNTSVHPEILLSGTPSLYCFELERLDFDRYGYVKQGLILQWKRELEISEIDHFYSQTSIINTLKQHLDLDLGREESFAKINELIFE